MITYIQSIKDMLSEPPTVVIGEPCFENPCSYDAIDEVYGLPNIFLIVW